MAERIATFRAYVENRITDEGGGDFVRIIDFEAPDKDKKFILGENGGPVELPDKHLPTLEPHETFTQIVEIDPLDAVVEG